MPLEKVQTDEAPRAIGPYSQAVKVGDFVFASGQIGIDPKTGQMDGKEIRNQTFRVLQNLEAVLKASGVGLDKVVKTTIYLTDLTNFGAVNDIYQFKFTADPRPARETVEVSRLPKDALVEISCIAYIPKN